MTERQTCRQTGETERGRDAEEEEGRRTQRKTIRRAELCTSYQQALTKEITIFLKTGQTAS